jgi:hypothetical protein
VERRGKRLGECLSCAFSKTSAEQEGKPRGRPLDIPGAASKARPVITRTSFYVRRGERDAEMLRSALANALRSWATRSGDYQEVEPSAHADQHAEIGPMGSLPWTPPWLAFRCDDALCESAPALAQWISARLGGEVLALVERGDDDVEVVLYRDGSLLPAPPLPPRCARENDEDFDPDDPPTAGEAAIRALGLRVLGDGMMLLAFRAREGVRLVEGPPALVDLRSVFVELAPIHSGQLYRLRMGATSAGGESRGVRIVAAGSALTKRLIVVVKASWDSENSLVDGSDDEGPFVSRDVGPGMVAELPKARLRAARADGIVSWTWNDPRSSDLRRFSSSSVCFDVHMVAGSREGKGTLELRVEPHGAPADGDDVEVPIVVQALHGG